LIGHDEEEFILFGMLTQVEEGKMHLEDEDAHIELVFYQTVSTLLDEILWAVLTALGRQMTMGYSQMDVLC
jgi:hypothetical protein